MTVTKRRDIQGLRAVAILLVVLYHVGAHVPGGFTGVDVFFVISGFVITAMLVRELSADGRIALARFYARRVRRLLPALALLIVVVDLAGILACTVNGQRMTALTGAFASVFTANAYLYRLGTGYFDVNTAQNALLHTWTLAVEEQFYVLFPALLLIAWRIVGRRRSLRLKRLSAAAAVGVVSLVSFCLSYLLSYGHLAGHLSAPQRMAFYSSPTRAWEFGLGALIALGEPMLRRIPAVASVVLGFAGAVLVVAGALTTHGTAHFPGLVALLPVLGAGALIVAGTSGTRGVSRLLAVSAVVWIGDLSYSWYLWHWPAIVYAKALWPGSGAAVPLAGALSLVPAWLSFRWVESPIRNNKSFVGRKALALAAACVSVSLLASAVLVVVGHDLRQTDSVLSWGRAELMHADAARGCDSPLPLGHRQADQRCTWPVKNAKGSIVLVGDSNAGHFTEPVTRAGNRAGYDVVVATLSGCPFVALRVEGSASGEHPCRTFVAGTLAELLRRRPSLVILAARTDGYIEASSSELGALPNGALSKDPVRKAELWDQALQAVLAPLERAHIPTIVVSPVPTMPVEPSGCAMLLILTSSCRSTISQATVDRELARAVTAEQRAVAATPGATRLDFEHDFCRHGTCSSIRNGQYAYRNVDHLSIAGALSLTDEFERAIRAHARPRP